MDVKAKDFQNVTRALKAVIREVEKIQKQASKPAKKKTTKAKAVKKAPAKKTRAKKAPAKKAPAKRGPKKKVAVKKATAKKSATAIATVTAIINRSKKGVNTATLMKKTGYNKKKIANLVFKLKQQGKIKSIEKGVYVKA